MLLGEMKRELELLLGDGPENGPTESGQRDKNKTQDPNGSFRVVFPHPLNKNLTAKAGGAQVLEREKPN